jgi:hypothetical protein
MPRSNRATKPRKRKTQTKAEKLPTSKGQHIGLRWVARVLLGALALIGSLLGIYGYLMPKISVASSSLLEPTKPFSAPFTISNSGNISVRHGRFRCVI